MRKSALAGGLAATALVAFAQPAGAYRPFDGTHADVTEQGRLDLEIGPAARLVSGQDFHIVAPAVTVSFGFAPGWEVVAETKNLIGVSNARWLGLEDSVLSLKTILRDGILQDRPGLSLALEVEAFVPDMGGEAGFGAASSVIVSSAWGPLLGHANLELSRSSAGDWSITPDLILEGPQDWSVRPVVEAGIEQTLGGKMRPFGLVGAIVRTGVHLDLDVGLHLKQEGATLAQEIRAGLSWSAR